MFRETWARAPRKRECRVKQKMVMFELKILNIYQRVLSFTFTLLLNNLYSTIWIFNLFSRERCIIFYHDYVFLIQSDAAIGNGYLFTINLLKTHNQWSFLFDSHSIFSCLLFRKIVVIILGPSFVMLLIMLILVIFNTSIITYCSHFGVA